jgi:hypothetical protein
MNKIEVLPYKAEHGIEIMKTLFEPHDGLPEEMKDSADYNGQYSKEAYTLLVDDEPIISGGFFLIHEGVAEGWLFVSEKARAYPVLSVLKLRIYIKATIEKYNLKRLQATILKSFQSGNRLAEILGFTLETPDGMKNFGHNGDTYMLYSLTGEK